MDKIDITKVLQHRFPFLLVDKIISIDKDNQSIVGIKNVSTNEPFFPGHFPNNPIFPGVLITEALAQISSALLVILLDKGSRLVYLAKINDMKFLTKVVPGDVLELHAKQTSFKFGIAVLNVHATVNKEIVCQGSITCKVDDAL